jgi:hypothetical protein
VSADFVNIPMPGMPELPESPTSEGGTPAAGVARKPAVPAGAQEQVTGQMSLFDDRADDGALEAA